MTDDYTSTAEQTRYVRADELAQSAPVHKRSWLWPWGVLGVIAFLALTGFFMALLKPAPKTVRINAGTIATTPLGDEPSVAAPLPGDSRLVATPAILSADTVEPNTTATAEAATPQSADPVGLPLPETTAAEPARTVPPVDMVSPLVGKAPRIAILVMDLGEDAKTTRAAIDQLPAAVDLGFGNASSRAAMTAAMASGHKVWLGIPMQPRRYPAINPGPKTLLLKNSSTQNSLHLSTAMEQAAPGISGLYNIMGSAFTADRSALAPVMAAAQNNGLAFFDTRAGADTVAAKLAREQSIPAAINDAYLDGEPEKLTARLNDLASRAKSRGVAVGVLGPSPRSIAGLKAWLATPAGQSVELVSARAVAATAGLQKIQP
jgi:uncharacterized protein